MVTPDLAGDFRFNIVVKNFDTADSPLAFLEVKTTYSKFPIANACKSPSKYVQIPALKPNKTWSYESKIEDLGATSGSPYVVNCTCKKNGCWGRIRFTLHKAWGPYPVAQMTGPNTSWELS